MAKNKDRGRLVPLHGSGPSHGLPPTAIHDLRRPVSLSEEDLALLIEEQFGQNNVHLSDGVKRLYYPGYDIEDFAKRAARAILDRFSGGR